MLTVSSTQQSRVRLKVEELFLISNQVQASQLRLRHHVDEQFDSSSRRLIDIMDSQADFGRVFEDIRSSLSTRDQLPWQRGSTENCSPYPVIGIRTYAPPLRQACFPSCRCMCHQPRYMKSPRFLNNILGTMFFGYSGCPSGGLQNCTDSACLAQSEFRAYVNYYFPSWLLSKAMTLILMLGTANGPCLTLTVRSIVPSDAEIFRLADFNDVTGLQRLFSRRLASPNDLLAYTGVNALIVRLFHFNIKHGISFYMIAFRRLGAVYSLIFIECPEQFLKT